MMPGMRQAAHSGSPYEATVGFSRAVRVGDTIHVSGTGPVWPDGHCDPSPATQADRCFAIIAEALHELGVGLDDVVRTRIYITDPAAADAVSTAHARALGHVAPAATMVIVAALLDPRWVVEIEADAVRH